MQAKEQSGKPRGEATKRPAEGQKVQTAAPLSRYSIYGRALTCRDAVQFRLGCTGLYIPISNESHRAVRR